jgi:hypothetical protein
MLINGAVDDVPFSLFAVQVDAAQVQRAIDQLQPPGDAK